MALHSTLRDEGGRILFRGNLSEAADRVAARAAELDDEGGSPDVLSQAAQGRLKTIVQRIERLEQDKTAVTEDIKGVYGEAKGEGFDPKIIRKIIRLKKKSAAQRAEEDALTDLYLAAIGGL